MNVFDKITHIKKKNWDSEFEQLYKNAPWVDLDL